MKALLKEFACAFVLIVGTVIQLVSLVFEGIGWVMSECGELLVKISDKIDKADNATKEEETSEETPEEGMNEEGDLA